MSFVLSILQRYLYGKYILFAALFKLSFIDKLFSLGATFHISFPVEYIFIAGGKCFRYTCIRNVINHCQSTVSFGSLLNLSQHL